MQFLQAFLNVRPVWSAEAIACALLAAIAAATLLYSAPRVSEPDVGPASHGVRFAVIAAALGIVPVVVGHLLFLVLGHAYHAFSAVPWLCLLVGVTVTRAPRRAWQLAMTGFVGVSALGLAYRAPDLEQDSGWRFHIWNWQEVERIDAVTRRLGDDVRRWVPERAPAPVVLYEAMPFGAFFQTEDGPATREVLRSPSARGYWVNSPQPMISGSGLRILTFDKADGHLHAASWSQEEALRRTRNAVIAGRGPAAYAFAEFDGPRHAPSFDRTYLRAAAMLLQGHPEAFVSGLQAAGVTDSVGPTPSLAARMITSGSPTMFPAFEAMLRRPLSAAAHSALAESLLAARVLGRAAVELRIATALDASRWSDRLLMAQLMVYLGGSLEARAELEAIARSVTAGDAAQKARELLSQLPASNPASAVPSAP